MSIDTEKIRQKITIIQKMILAYQRWLALILKNRPIVVIHHTATSRDTTTFEAIDQDHYRKKYLLSKQGYYSAYNTLIEGNGDIHHARGYDENGEGTGTFNGFHLDICLTGNFNIEQPSQEQLKSLEMELTIIEHKYGSYVLKVHQDYYPTDCCGVNLISWVRQRS